MNDDWVTIYVIVVLSIAAVPIMALMFWSFFLCLEEIKDIRIQRRNTFHDNLRSIIGGTAKLASLTSKNPEEKKKSCDIENIPIEMMKKSSSRDFMQEILQENFPKDSQVSKESKDDVIFNTKPSYHEI